MTLDLSVDGLGFTYRDLNAPAQRLFLALRLLQHGENMADQIREEGQQTRDSFEQVKTTVGTVVQRLLDDKAADAAEIATLKQQVLDLGGQVTDLQGKAADADAVASDLDTLQTEMNQFATDIAKAGVPVEPPAPVEATPQAVKAARQKNKR